MLEQVGTVVDTDGVVATVSFMRASACEGCHRHAEGCSACSLLGGDRRHLARVRNPIGAPAGARVRVASSERRMLAYAALVFLFPLLLALAFYLVGAAVWGAGSLPAGLLAAAGFLLAFLVTMSISAFLSRRLPEAEIIALINNREGE